MKIKREGLLTLVREEIDRLEAEERRRQEREAYRADEARECYVRATTEHWRTLANRLRRAVTAGHAVTYDLVPEQLRSRHGDTLPFYRPSREVQPREVGAELRTLLRVLEVVEDEYVTTTALERNGFTLGRVLRGVTR